MRRPTVEANRFGFATVPTHDSLFGLLMIYLRCFSFLFAVSSLGWWLPTCRAEEQSGVDFFESKIRPLLIEHCYECHSVESGESSGNLLLDSATASQAGGDRVDVITRGLLGLTVAFARCHDHKFDPVPTKDHYAMAGILLSSDQPTDGASPLMMRDADNRYAMRGNLRRRDFEAVRDSMLLVSGTIDRTLGGDPVDISVQGSRPR